MTHSLGGLLLLCVALCLAQRRHRHHRTQSMTARPLGVLSPRPRGSAAGALILALASACSEPSAPSLARRYILTLSPDTLVLRVGHQAQLSVEVRLGSAVLSDPPVRFRSTDTAVAVVVGNGWLTSVGVGSARIVAAYDSAADTTVVLVPARQPTRLVIGTALAAVPRGGTFAVSVTVFDVDSTIIANASLTYEASDTALFTVSPAGVINGRASGRGHLRVTIAGLRDSVPVAVFEPFTGTATSILLPGGPFGVATSSSVAIVTQFAANSLTRLILPSLATSAPLAVDSGPTDVALTADGTRAYTANQLALTVSVIDVAGWRVTTTYPIPQYVGSAPNRPIRIALSPDAARVYVGTSEGYVHVLNAATGSVDTTLWVRKDITDLDFTWNGQRLVGVNLYGEFFVVRTSDRHIERRTNIGLWVHGVAVTHDDSLTYVAAENGTRIVTFRTGARSDSLVPELWGYHLRMTPDERFLAVAGALFSGPLGHYGLGMVDPRAEYLVAFYPSVGANRVAMNPSGPTMIMTTQDGLIVVR